MSSVAGITIEMVKTRPWRKPRKHLVIPSDVAELTGLHPGSFVRIKRFTNRTITLIERGDPVNREIHIVERS